VDALDSSGFGSGLGREISSRDPAQSRLRPLLQPHLQVAIAILAVASLQADYQVGLDAYHAGDYDTALAEWTAEVNQPAPPANLAVYREALYAIAILYWQGKGVAQDYAKSAVWLKQAADINHPDAQVKLGYLYSTGQGVPQNYQEARRWLQMAAVQGDRDAAHNLDILDREGLGWPDAAGAALAQQETTANDLEATGAEFDAVAVPGTQHAAALPTDPTVSRQTLETEAAAQADLGEAWILAQDPEHFTIQVIALRNPKPLFDFMTQYPDWSPFAIYTPAGNAFPLWVMLQGNYPDVRTARAAAAKFPGGLQQQDDLWIRKFRMVQGMIE